MWSKADSPPWMSRVLATAGVYNLAWGLCVTVFPEITLQWTGLEPPVDYPQFWQCIGMIVGTYGIGYLLAARNPMRHWPIVCVGLLGKVFGPVGYFSGLVAGTLPAAMAWTILANDLIWWLPFSVILWHACKYHQTATPSFSGARVLHDALSPCTSRRTAFEPINGTQFRQPDETDR